MATPLTGNMHVKWQTIKANDCYKRDKHEKFENDTVGWGLPAPCKNGCYTLVAIQKVGFLLRALELAL